MADSVRSARRAIGRGATSEALVHLWNAVEPARLAGDSRRLRAIAGLAQRIRAQGNESDAVEAERLLDVLRTAAGNGGGPAATKRLDATVSAGGELLDASAVGEPMDADMQAEAETSRAGRIGNLVWIALVLLIVLINVVGQIRDGG